MKYITCEWFNRKQYDAKYTCVQGYRIAHSLFIDNQTGLHEDTSMYNNHSYIMSNILRQM